MKTIKNITFTLITLSLISFFTTTGFAGTNAENNTGDGPKVYLTSGVPAEINSRYLNGK